MKQTLGFEVSLNRSYEDAIEWVTEALKEEGFGVLTRIDLHTILHEKIGADLHPYTILGACNPNLAYAALSRMPETGLMLPCNVTVEADIRGGSRVRIVNPEVLLGGAELEQAPALRKVATEARERLERVAQSLEEAERE